MGSVVRNPGMRLGFPNPNPRKRLRGCRAPLLARPPPAQQDSCFSYIHRNLRLVIPEEIENSRGIVTESLTRREKLILVLDVDHTLLHSTHLRDLTRDECYLLHDDNRLLFLERSKLLVKLRPFVRTFLKKASSMFDMYLYTMGAQDYALEIAELLDPDGTYFHSRVISRDDSTSKKIKGLDVVQGDERMVVVLDDSKTVWMNHRDNQITMLPYNYFSSGRNAPCKNKTKSLAELRTDESLEDGSVLQYMLLLLMRIHINFFSSSDDPAGAPSAASRDVRPLLKSMKGQVLRGYKLAFSCSDLLGRYWKMAESLGARCCTKLDSSVTHVVLPSCREDHATKQWAIANNKLFVPQAWLLGAYYLWYAQPEEWFKNL